MKKRMKKLRKTETKKLQIHTTGSGVVYSIVIPISHIRVMEWDIEPWIGRFKKGDKMTVTLLEDEPGVIIRPLREEDE